MAWRPGQRAAELELEAPYEDVPHHLNPALWGWINRYLQTSADVTFALIMHLRVGFTDPRRGRFAHEEAVNQLRSLLSASPHYTLDSVEWLLAEFGDYSDRAQDLERALALANSAYRVRADFHGLELRSTPEVRDVVQATVHAALGSAGEHLATAWNGAYGRTPDPVKAYSEAVKAVESAGAPVISPTNARTTLGTMIKDVSNKPSKWAFVLTSKSGNSVEDVARMMGLLWDGQTSRHGGNTPTVPETLDAARAAVHMSAALVHFFVSDAMSRVEA